MSLSDWVLNQAEINRAKAVLQDDKQVVLQPQQRMHPVEAFFLMLPAA